MTTPSLSPRGEATPSALESILRRAPAAMRDGIESFYSLETIAQARSEVSALLAEAQAARAKAIEEVVGLCKKREDHLERTSKQLDHSGQMEHYYRILEADYIGRAVAALSPQRAAGSEA